MRLRSCFGHWIFEVNYNLKFIEFLTLINLIFHEINWLFCGSFIFCKLWIEIWRCSWQDLGKFLSSSLRIPNYSGIFVVCFSWSKKSWQDLKKTLTDKPITVFFKIAQNVKSFTLNRNQRSPFCFPHPFFKRTEFQHKFCGVKFQ